MSIVGCAPAPRSVSGGLDPHEVANSTDPDAAGSLGSETSPTADPRKALMRFTVERVLNDSSIDTFYSLYLGAFGPLRTEAAARHLLTRAEFEAEMRDERIEKYIITDDEQSPLALATLTRDLSAIPWISFDYYYSRYENAIRRGALYYLGYILVGDSHRRSKALLMLTDRINRTLSDAGGVLGFDLCQRNDQQGIGRFAMKLLGSSNDIKLLDTQRYYAASYQSDIGPTGSLTDQLN